MLRIHGLSRDYTLLGSFDDTLDSSLNEKSFVNVDLCDVACS